MALPQDIQDSINKMLSCGTNNLPPTQQSVFALACLMQDLLTTTNASTPPVPVGISEGVSKDDPKKKVFIVMYSDGTTKKIDQAGNEVTDEIVSADEIDFEQVTSNCKEDANGDKFKIITFINADTQEEAFKLVVDASNSVVNVDPTTLADCVEDTPLCTVKRDVGSYVAIDNTNTYVVANWFAAFADGETFELDNTGNAPTATLQNITGFDPAIWRAAPSAGIAAFSINDIPARPNNDPNNKVRSDLSYEIALSDTITDIRFIAESVEGYDIGGLYRAGIKLEVDGKIITPQKFEQDLGDGFYASAEENPNATARENAHVEWRIPNGRTLKVTHNREWFASQRITFNANYKARETEDLTDCQIKAENLELQNKIVKLLAQANLNQSTITKTPEGQRHRHLQAGDNLVVNSGFYTLSVAPKDGSTILFDAEMGEETVEDIAQSVTYGNGERPTATQVTITAKSDLYVFWEV